MNTPPEIVSFCVGPFESNCYFLVGDGACVLIDPGDEADRIAQELERRDLRPEAILLTHGHMDHIMGVAALQARFPSPVYLHPADAAWAFSEQNRLPPWYNTPPRPPADLRDPRAPNPLVLGPWVFRVIETPGHSPGGVCYQLPDFGLLFSGDTLFRGSIGRTDLPGGHPETLAQSLLRLLALPPETRVYPGHGPETTLAEEREGNPWL